MKEVADGRDWQSILGISYQKDGKIHHNLDRPRSPALNSTACHLSRKFTRVISISINTTARIVSIRMCRSTLAAAVRRVAPSVYGRKLQLATPIAPARLRMSSQK